MGKFGSSSECVGSKNIVLLTNIEKAYIFLYYFSAKKKRCTERKCMLTKKILKIILNVKHTIIDDIRICPDGSIAIMVHPTKGEQCRCGKCGKKAVRYDKGRGIRSWRACDWNTHKVYIMADMPRVVCPEHGVLAASVPWAPQLPLHKRIRGACHLAFPVLHQVSCCSTAQDFLEHHRPYHQQDASRT